MTSTARPVTAVVNAGPTATVGAVSVTASSQRTPAATVTGSAGIPATNGAPTGAPTTGGLASLGDMMVNSFAEALRTFAGSLDGRIEAAVQRSLTGQGQQAKEPSPW